MFESVKSFFTKNLVSSVDLHPWRHPFLNPKSIEAFRAYSEEVWEFALRHRESHSRTLRCAFIVNMAQNMYKWGCLAQRYGVEAVLYPHPQDSTALNCPEWEEFNGEYVDVMDAKKFLKENDDIKLRIPCHRIPTEGSKLFTAYRRFRSGNRKDLLNVLAQSPGVRHEVLLEYEGVYPFYDWCKALGSYDVIYAASMPVAAYGSGRPYCVFSVGGDLQYDCGRGDEYGEIMILSFNAAKFLMISNPHTLGHSRRLGLSNGVYLPYPMDDSRYSPGDGMARRIWQEKYGDGVYVLTTTRLDEKVKGHDEEFFAALVEVARRNPDVRFVFLRWGAHVREFEANVRSSGLSSQFVLLPPVGKTKLIDYYRSTDIVLDHFVWGYYGATTLEAAAVGKPVIMKLREDQYHPLYSGDVAPVENVGTVRDLVPTLGDLIGNLETRRQKGRAMRDWLVRNHGEDKTVPLMLALLQLAADQVCLPEEVRSPLLQEETPEEMEYHLSCRRNSETG